MGKFMSGIDFGQATPPSPDNQGGMGPVYMQTPLTSDKPATGFVEPADNSADADDIALRGYRVDPIGGSATPGTPNPLGMEGRSNMS